MELIHLDPVGQSIISLTKLLIKDKSSVLIDLKSSVLIFFAVKLRTAFELQKLLTIFSAKNGTDFAYKMSEI